MTHRRRSSSHKEILKILGLVKPNTRKTLLKDADKALIYSLCELCDNTLSGNLRLSPAERQKLSKYKNLLRRLATRGESWKHKKQILIQKGGGAFLPLFLSFVGPMLGKLLFPNS